VRSQSQHKRPCRRTGSGAGIARLSQPHGQRMGLPHPVKGSLRRASPALDWALQTRCGGVGLSDPWNWAPTPRTGWPHDLGSTAGAAIEVVAAQSDPVPMSNVACRWPAHGPPMARIRSAYGPLSVRFWVTCALALRHFSQGRDTCRTSGHRQAPGASQPIEAEVQDQTQF
jgi:hypothetical protein